MFVRICLLSALAMGALAGPAASADGASAAWREQGERPPIVMAQLQRFINKKIHVSQGAVSQLFCAMLRGTGSFRHPDRSRAPRLRSGQATRGAVEGPVQLPRRQEEVPRLRRPLEGGGFARDDGINSQMR